MLQSIASCAISTRSSQMGASRLNLLHKHEDAHDDALWCSTWVPNQSQCITGSVDECVKVWAVQDEAPFVENSHTYTSHTLGVVSVTVDPTGTFAASSALDSFIRVWNLQVRPQDDSVQACKSHLRLCAILNAQVSLPGSSQT